LKEEKFDASKLIEWLFLKTKQLKEKLFEELQLKVPNFKEVESKTKKLLQMKNYFSSLENKFENLFQDTISKIEEKVENIKLFCENEESLKEPKLLGDSLFSIQNSPQYIQNLINKEKFELVKIYEQIKSKVENSIITKLDNICKIADNPVDDNSLQLIRNEYQLLNDLVKTEQLKDHLPKTLEENLSTNFTKTIIDKCSQTIDTVKKKIDEESSFDIFKEEMITLINLRKVNSFITDASDYIFKDLKNTIEEKIKFWIEDVLNEIRKIDEGEEGNINTRKIIELLKRLSESLWLDDYFSSLISRNLKKSSERLIEYSSQLTTELEEDFEESKYQQVSIKFKQIEAVSKCKDYIYKFESVENEKSVVLLNFNNSRQLLKDKLNQICSENTNFGEINFEELTKNLKNEHDKTSKKVEDSKEKISLESKEKNFDFSQIIEKLKNPYKLSEDLCRLDSIETLSRDISFQENVRRTRETVNSHIKQRIEFFESSILNSVKYIEEDYKNFDSIKFSTNLISICLNKLKDFYLLNEKFPRYIQNNFQFYEYFNYCCSKINEVLLKVYEKFEEAIQSQDFNVAQKNFDILRESMFSLDIRITNRETKQQIIVFEKIRNLYEEAKKSINKTKKEVSERLEENIKNYDFLILSQILQNLKNEPNQKQFYQQSLTKIKHCCSKYFQEINKAITSFKVNDQNEAYQLREKLENFLKAEEFLAPFFQDLDQKEESVKLFKFDHSSLNSAISVRINNEIEILKRTQDITNDKEIEQNFMLLDQTLLAFGSTERFFIFEKNQNGELNKVLLSEKIQNLRNSQEQRVNIRLKEEIDKCLGIRKAQSGENVEQSYSSYIYTRGLDDILTNSGVNQKYVRESIDYLYENIEKRCKYFVETAKKRK